MASPMNSMTMPWWSSMTLDMSLKYLLSNSSDCSGSRCSTMVVKPAMSEKKIVTSLVFIPGFASTPALSSICTTGHGTYFPQDLIAFFMLLKMRLIMRISAQLFSIFTSSMFRPAICSCTMLCISSASVRRGFSRLSERKLRSFVSSVMPSKIINITVKVVSTDTCASDWTCSRASKTAADMVPASTSASVLSSHVSFMALSRKTRMKTRSPAR
mmetsp:Transcript_63175/g.206144  ORF Transcript_63175/g.206144 Transcript_63175/m.206144 type:complete len:214 (-) Transcript_63175:1940-2581(-)